MANIFISYRRDDTRIFSARIHDRLVYAFGREKVFFDVDKNIPAGSTWKEVLQTRLEQSDVLLVIIGQRWEQILQDRESGDDWVRYEIEHGLSRDDMLVIPVLVDGAPVPKNLGSIGTLTDRQIFQVRHDPDFNNDMQNLAHTIREWQRQQHPVRIGLPVVIVALIIVIAAIAGLLLLSQNSDDDPTPSPTTKVAQAADTIPTTNTPTATETSSATPTPTLTRTPTLSLTELEKTVQFMVDQEQTRIAETNAAEQTATEQARTAVAQGTADSQTQTAEAWTPTPTPNLRETANARLTQTQIVQENVATQEAANMTATALLWTDTPTATSTSTQTPTETLPSTDTPTNTRTPTSTPSPTDTPEADTQISVTGSETVSFVEIPDGPNINLRAGPGTNFEIVDTAVPGQSFEILETDTDWFRIGDETWIFSGVVETFEREIEYATVTGFGSSLDNTIANNDDWTPIEHDLNGVTMVLVPAGSFEMGSTEGEVDTALEMCEQAADSDAECQRSWYEDMAPNGDNTQTFSQPFWIDKYEVTRAQYQACIDAGACEETPSSDYSTEDNQPINRVAWFQAQAYCEWQGGRLPTEAEWEYAARGPDRLLFPWGNTFEGTVANHCDSNCGDSDWASDLNYVNEENDDGFAITSPVGSFPAGASWVGALDLSGNVWEWTSSLYLEYPYGDDHENTSDTRV